MGEVYKARDTRLDRTVAIKVLPPEFSADPERRARFEREAKTIAGLNHPHICALHDIGREGDIDFLVKTRSRSMPGWNRKMRTGTTVESSRCRTLRAMVASGCRRTCFCPIMPFRPTRPSCGFPGPLPFKSANQTR